MTPCVSIIIACYNSQGMLNDALASLQDQTLKDIEIIVINDNPDDYDDEKIVLERKCADPRIKYKKNSINCGTGMCRQIGVDLAEGEFIGFLDADDFALPNAYESLYLAALKDGSSIAVGNSKVSDSRDFSKIKINKYDGAQIIIDGCKLYELQLNRIKMPYYLRVDWCNKIYRRDLFTDHKITFPKVVRHEGFMSTIMSLLAKKVTIINNILFIVYKSSNSVSKRFRIENISDMIEATLHYMKWLKKLNFINIYYKEFINFSFFVIFNTNLQHILKYQDKNKHIAYLKKMLLAKDIFPHFNAYLMLEKRDVELEIFMKIMGNINEDIHKIYDTDYFYRIDEFKKIHFGTIKPIVSIVTITKNIIKQGRVNSLLEAISSIQRQTYGVDSIEHLIIDGASQDGTVDFLLQQLKEGNVTRVVSEKDDGIYNAMNKGILYASGDYILFLNSDDKLDKNCLQTLIDLCISEKTDYAFCDAAIIDKNGRPVGSHIGDINKIYFGTPYCHQALLCSKKCYSQVKYNENFKLTMWPFALDLFNKGFKFSYINKKLAYFRTGGLSASPLFVQEQTSIKNYIASKLNIDFDEYEQINCLIRRKPLQISLEQIISLLKKIFAQQTEFSNSFYSKTYNLLCKNEKFNAQYSKILQYIPIAEGIDGAAQ